MKKCVLFVIAITLLTITDNLRAQGTAFTYQGQLHAGTNLASGKYDFQFALSNAPIGGSQIGGTLTNLDVGVTNGLFITTLDFSNVFNGESAWLGISVRSNGTGSYMALNPPQPLTPAPYAVYAESANATNLVGLVSGSQLSSIGNSIDNNNFFVGPAGNATTSGQENTAIGFRAFYANTQGIDNTAIGFQALYANSSGAENTASGAGALQNNTTGSFNTANGRYALLSNTTGSDNTAGGAGALVLNTTGSYNTASGVGALLSNTTGTDNTADGAGALDNNTTGSFNTASGFQALSGNDAGSNNIALGYEAGANIIEGSSNIDIGNVGVFTDTNIIRLGTGQTAAYIAGLINGNGGGLTNLNASQLYSIGNGNSGSFNNFFTGPAGNATNTGSNNTAVGVSALGSNDFGSGNTAIGVSALGSNINGFANTACGQQALYANINGVFNTAGGQQALFANTSGQHNTAFGAGALSSNTTGSANIALGLLAGWNITTGSSNIDIGNHGLATDANIIRIGDGQSATYIAGVINGNGSGLTGLNASNLTGTIPVAQIPNLNGSMITSIGNGNSSSVGNFFIGPAGNATTTGFYNTANGSGALLNNTTGSYDTASGGQALSTNTTGSGDTASGAQALFANSSGSYNTANGSSALFLNTTGSNNTASGYSALLDNTTGSFNIALGYLAGENIATGSSNIDLGNLGLATDTNIIRIGTGQTDAYLSGVIHGSAGATFAGNVGIGTNAPTENLTIANVTGFNSGLRLTGTNNGGIGMAIENTVAGGHKYDLFSVGPTFQPGVGAFALYDDTAHAYRLIVSTNGSVGIGTTAPTSTLDVQGSGDFTGNLGVGTTTPANKLDVQGSGDFTGSVGIGTTTPSKGALEVDLNNGIQPGYSQVGALTTSGAGPTGVTGGPGVSIWAAGAVFAPNFFAFSDERIKNIQGQSDGAADLKTLLGIKITDYTYKDTIAKGDRPQKKVIAQQVEKIFPQAVSQSTDEVPDIYKRAAIQDGWVQLATDLKVGERVKLIGEKEQGIYPVLEVRDGAFRTDFKPKTDKLFVYGREVNDFRTVDYDAIAMLNVSATQELAHKVDAQENELAELHAELAKLRSEKTSLASAVSELKARDQAREDRLARLETSLEKISAHGAYASLKQ